MPNSYFDRKKQGFSIPIFNWFMEDMDKLFEDYFSDNRLKNIDILNAKEIQREYRKYKIYKTRNKDYNIEKMWRLLSFMLWWERCNKR